ncbi:hypothetical protein A464_2182 [Salmonella bongori N268-08]|uniref:Uncharacterized protein n=1 Tax=Salmonella bongori N268-08 TaxID=1197719 RepID=S5NGH9_SALBN|nr:hypothetical protein A464_2182 [Salmonella bongori N268-08]
MNVAHSGNVVVMLDRGRYDVARLQRKLAEKRLAVHWIKQH